MPPADTKEARMAMIQQELKAQTPEDELDELDEEEPRRRPWGAILSVTLALAVIFVGYQWHQASAREQTLGGQAHALRAEAESLRLRVDEAQREVDGLQKKVAALGAEKAALGERIVGLERAAQEHQAALRAAEQKSAAATAAAARERARAVPVVQKKSR
jgi:chromosome segregation ATPase